MIDFSKEQLEEEIKRLSIQNLEDAEESFQSSAIITVVETEKIYGVDSKYTDDYEWVDDEGNVICDQDLAEMNEMEDNLPVNWEKVYYVTRRRFIQSFFTIQGAKDYIYRNSHRLRSPEVYVETANDNPEMAVFKRYALKLLEEKVNHHDS